MRKKIPSKFNNRKNSGFTLVELIVVLVILAILATILIPALMGYIDRAKKQQNILNARNAMTATQAGLVDLYAKSGGEVAANASIIPGSKTPGNNGDCDATNTDFAKKVLETADLTGDNEPYCYMIAVGSNYSTTAKVTDKDKYTVFYALYIDKEDSPHIYYYNGDWSDNNPRKNNSNKILSGTNEFASGPYKGKKIQYYLISNKSGKDFSNNDFWGWIKKD